MIVDRSQRDTRGCFIANGGIVASSPRDLPDQHTCNVCNQTKPVDEMIVIYNRKEKVYYLRPRCKDCHNKKERGHRREWKRNYLRAWRKRNRQVNESYWKDNADVREQGRLNAARRLANPEYHEAVLIQGRLRRQLKLRITIVEAKELLAQFGRCYPSRFGLTEAGLRECERIRSTMRRNGTKKRFSAIQIRMMVYEDGYFINPSRQPQPYQNAAEKLRRWQASRRSDLRKAA